MKKHNINVVLAPNSRWAWSTGTIGHPNWSKNNTKENQGKLPWHHYTMILIHDTKVPALDTVIPIHDTDP